MLFENTSLLNRVTFLGIWAVRSKNKSSNATLVNLWRVINKRHKKWTHLEILDIQEILEDHFHHY